MRGRLTFLCAGAIVVAGCGSSGEDEQPAAQKPASTPAAAAGPKQTATDAIKDFTFTPKSVTVAAGGSVTWTNEDAANHNVAFDDKSVEGIGNLREGKSGKVSFAKPGTYAYVCTYHPGMEGTVVVK